VRELGLLTLEEAVRKMTSATAQRYGLADRGFLRPGYAADIVVFDPEEIEDTATYENPFRYPKGIHYVLVNGKLSVGEGQLQGVHGTVLRRKR
jgi:N-acyl-D-amino-acid deacylase